MDFANPTGALGLAFPLIMASVIKPDVSRETRNLQERLDALSH
jgi:hypothetical protein